MIGAQPSQLTVNGKIKIFGRIRQVIFYKKKYLISHDHISQKKIFEKSITLR